MLTIHCKKKYLDEAKELVAEEYITHITEDNKVITEYDHKAHKIDYAPIRNRANEDILYEENGLIKEAFLHDVILPERSGDGIGRVLITLL